MKRLLIALAFVLIASSAAQADVIFENKTNRVLDIYVTDGTNMARSFTIETSDKITIPASREGKIEIKYAGSKYNQTILETVKHSGNDKFTVTEDKEGKIKVKKVRKYW